MENYSALKEAADSFDADNYLLNQVDHN
jgi:hypothetical protein